MLLRKLKALARNNYHLTYIEHWHSWVFVAGGVQISVGLEGQKPPVGSRGTTLLGVWEPCPQKKNSNF